MKGLIYRKKKKNKNKEFFEFDWGSFGFIESSEDGRLVRSRLVGRRGLVRT